MGRSGFERADRQQGSVADHGRRPDRLSVALGAPYLVSWRCSRSRRTWVAFAPCLRWRARWPCSAPASVALHGLGRRAHRHPLTAMFGALMVCAGLALSAHGEVWQLYVGHGLLDRTARQRRHQRAPLRLRDTLVRAPPRHGPRADRQRPVRGRRLLATAVRALAGGLRLAEHHGGFRYLWSR